MEELYRFIRLLSRDMDFGSSSNTDGDNKHAHFGGADEILNQMRLLTGGDHPHVFLRRTVKGRKALHSIRQKLRFRLQRTWISTIFDSFLND